MLAILSPAKDMKVDPALNSKSEFQTHPEFLNKAAGIITDLKKFRKEELSDLMKISEKLSVLNYDRYHNWKKDKHSKEQASPAILSFTGEAYRGLDAKDLSSEDLAYSQNVLRILSGVYGTLRPLDLILEYRLEMGTKHEFRKKRNLYALWEKALTSSVNKAIEASPGDNVLINVASNEYSSAINFKKLKHRVLTTSFYQEKEGGIKMVAVYAKRARGLMTRFIIKNRIENVEDLKAFDLEGYYFDNSRSTDDKWIFVR